MVLDIVCIFTFFIYGLYVVLLKRDQESGVGVAFGNEQVREYVLWTGRCTARCSVGGRMKVSSAFQDKNG